MSTSNETELSGTNRSMTDEMFKLNSPTLYTYTQLLTRVDVLQLELNMIRATIQQGVEI